MATPPCFPAAAGTGAHLQARRYRPHRFPLHRFLPTLLLAGLLTAGTSARAYDLQTTPYLFGDWAGLRTSLAERGVTLNLGYTGEAAHNFSGGQDKMTRYTDQWVFGATMDLDKLLGWHGGTFQMTITDRNGRNLGADAGIGNNMLIQEVYGRGQTWHMTQFWLNQSFLDNRVQWKIGRLTVGEDFASFSCDFQNLTFCGAQPGNLVGSYWVNWPTSQWATRLKVSTSEQTYVQAGVYQVNPNYVDDGYARRHGLSLDNPNGTTGALIPLEFGWLPAWNGLPGSYKFGAWYNTSNGADLYQDVNHAPRGETGLAPRERNGQHGIYINFEQQVSGTAGGRGASVFLNFFRPTATRRRRTTRSRSGCNTRGRSVRPATSSAWRSAPPTTTAAMPTTCASRTSGWAPAPRSATAMNTWPRPITAGHRSPPFTCDPICSTSGILGAPAPTTTPSS